ncbi:hypothetical protein K32_45340 [Kaistia sp. 32K]|uniref:BRCT domain-containing protein n=1 Tax=Kaistia sp. 32K TaxID=2795690 RepID=UPI001915992E|nr:BRCT domain-containing protein [Kaistia sp. 32K]BCP55917.1 hypothetical protein K32_45340 [Kaistia sp. 32K]
MDEKLINRFGADRLASRQVDELIGLARGLLADGKINQAEVEFLQKWLANNIDLNDQPLIGTLYQRVNDILADGIADEDEKAELFDTLSRFVGRDFELGEITPSSSLPLCSPAPRLSFSNKRYCFTGTFNYGQRKHCEAAVAERGATASGVSMKTDVLVIGAYATSSWKHSTFGNKILQAAQWRSEGVPISIVSEAHWVKHL